MVDKNRTIDAIAMNAKLTARSDYYEIKGSQIKQRPPAPPPMVKTTAVAPAVATKSPKE
jgi:hypothetical protein